MKIIRTGWFLLFFFHRVYIRGVRAMAISVVRTKMNEPPRHATRVSSDFSIARILGYEDNSRKSNESKCESEGYTGEINSSRFIDSDYILYSQANYKTVVEEYPSDLRSTGRCPSRLTELSTVESSSLDRSELKTCKTETSELSWLECTRYRPPKLPRKSGAGKIRKRRRPGLHPRIPFTASQLQQLEDKYRKCAYLSRRDVIQLSTALRLAQSRVKIWFQNRRARDRRETRINGGTSVSSLLDSAPSTYRSEGMPNEEATTSRESS